VEVVQPAGGIDAAALVQVQPIELATGQRRLLQTCVVEADLAVRVVDIPLLHIPQRIHHRGDVPVRVLLNVQALTAGARSTRASTYTGLQTYWAVGIVVPLRRSSSTCQSWE